MYDLKIPRREPRPHEIEKAKRKRIREEKIDAVLDALLEFLKKQND